MFAKFRSRKLETNRPLLVFRWDALAVDDDAAAGALLEADAARAMAPVATGVEKEEEDETHLQQALHTQLAGSARESYTIPTPEAAAVIDDYDALYSPISADEMDRRAQAALEATQSSLLRLPTEEKPIEPTAAYCADLSDISFAKRLGIPIDELERAVDALEDAAHRLSPQTAEAEARLRFPEMEALDAIASHWRKKRSDAPLVSRLRHEDAGKPGADPYVCFRRRELRAARRTRRSEGQVGERLARLRRDIDTAALLLDGIGRREALRADALAAEAALFALYVRADALPGAGDLLPFRNAATSVAAEARRKTDAPKAEDGPAHVHPAAVEAAALLKRRTHAMSSDLGMYCPDTAAAISAEFASLLAVCGEDSGPIWDDLHVPAFADGRRVRLVRSFQKRVLACDSFSGSETADAGDGLWLSGPSISRVLGPRLLGARDVGSLQTPLGNYNVHAVQTANTIQRPMSHQAWVASTAPILAAMTAAAAAAGSSGGSLLTTASRKRKASRPAPKASAEAVSRDATPRETPAARTTTPRDNSQPGTITVRVKTAPPQSDPTRPSS